MDSGIYIQTYLALAFWEWNLIKPPSLSGAEDMHSHQIEEISTLKPSSLMLGTCQGQVLLHGSTDVRFQTGDFCVASTWRMLWEEFSIGLLTSSLPTPLPNKIRASCTGLRVFHDAFWPWQSWSWACCCSNHTDWRAGLGSWRRMYSRGVYSRSRLIGNL